MHASNTARKSLFLISITVFSFLLGTRLPVLPQSEVRPDNVAQPWRSVSPASVDDLAATFPQVPLRLQAPVVGAVDLTEATIHQWLSDRSPEVFLTFDDGPSPKATGLILDLLKQHDVKATFFVLGRNAALFPEIIQRMVNEGHELALHSQTHADMLTLTHTQKAQEIADGLSTLHWYFPNVRIRWFRPPYGHYDQAVIDIAHEYGLCLAMFNDISIDSHSSVEQIRQTILNGKGKILVFHDGQMPRPSDLTEAEKRLIEGVAGAIAELKAQGGQLKTLSSHFGRFCP